MFEKENIYNKWITYITITIIWQLDLKPLNLYHEVENSKYTSMLNEIL